MNLALDTQERPGPNDIVLHGPEAFAAMRKSGRFAAEVLDFITPYVKPGVTTGELDQLCHDFHVEHGAVPGPLGYRGFPKSICTSINHDNMDCEDPFLRSDSIKLEMNCKSFDPHRFIHP